MRAGRGAGIRVRPPMQSKTAWVAMRLAMMASVGIGLRVAGWQMTSQASPAAAPNTQKPTLVIPRINRWRANRICGGVMWLLLRLAECGGRF